MAMIGINLPFCFSIESFEQSSLPIDKPSLTLLFLLSQGHLLWKASQVLSRFLELHAEKYLTSQNVLELGAGAGLPSLVAAKHAARSVVASDYPDPELVDNLRFNINTIKVHQPPTRKLGGVIAAEGYLWGADAKPLLAHLSPPSIAFQPEFVSSEPSSRQRRFNTLILADLLFNHTCHEALLSTIVLTLALPPEPARALVFFTPHRPWLFEKDLDFLRRAESDGRFLVTCIGSGASWDVTAASAAVDNGSDDSPTGVARSGPWQQQRQGATLGEPGRGQGNKTTETNKHWRDLGVTRLGPNEWLSDEAMFEQDRGDERLRRTIFGYEIRWKS